MCGINGIIYPQASGRTVDQDTLIRMRDVQFHRGPDEEGIYIEKNVGLGHRRLSIVDLRSGQQPMFNDDRSVVIVYNGEVYNHLELRPDLVERGYRFHTSSDTETILKAYEAYGAECVHHFRGMFAFAVWDSKKQQLFIARDRLGVKPLYYHLSEDGSFYFGSEIKTILEAGAVVPSLEYAAFSDYLANHGTSGELTLFGGIKRLLPGHTLSVSRDGLSVERYWDISFAKSDASERTDDEWVAEWFSLFENAVEMRLMSDVPLGMFLSGGIDSSAIAAVMSRLVSDPIKTFSVAFAEREANELRYARLVSDAFKTDHHEVVVSPEDFFAKLPDLIWHEDEPIAHPSSVALYFVSKLASEHVKVVLTGEGSDESLAGYGRYAKTITNLQFGKLYHSTVPGLVRNIVAGGIDKLSIDSRIRHKLKKSFFTNSPTIDDLYFNNFAVFSRAAQTELLSSGTKEQMNGSADPYREMTRLFDSAKSSDLLDKMLYVDTKTYLHELLMKQDQMSMAASIESRVPFLDHKLMEFSASMPKNMKLRGKTTKYVLRQAMKDVLPPEILSRGKMGFPVPVGKWFRGPYKGLIDEYVLSERALGRGLFDPIYIQALVDRHMKGENHDERLWALLNMEIWQRRFLDGEI